jgi:hypothetical protein
MLTGRQYLYRHAKAIFGERTALPRSRWPRIKRPRMAGGVLFGAIQEKRRRAGVVVWKHISNSQAEPELT